MRAIALVLLLAGCDTARCPPGTRTEGRRCLVIADGGLEASVTDGGARDAGDVGSRDAAASD